MMFWPLSAVRGWMTTLAALSACTVLPAAEQTGPRVYTQTPEIAPAEGAPEPAPATTPSVFHQGPTPQWIWGADDNKPYALRVKFAGGAQAARIRASCDNEMTLYLNGQKVASGDNWQEPAEADVQRHLRDGENELVAEVRNAGGPAAFVCKLALTRTGGKVDYVVSDSSWQAADARNAQNWVAVKAKGKLGMQPWGDVFAKSGGAARELFQLLPGFQVERLFTVPKEELGSWVCITRDHKGRLLVSDQGDKGLCRITPPALGSTEPTKVERLDVKITAAQGMLYAFDSLYLSVNGGPGSGLYRARDTNGDDQFDEVVKLKDFRGGGEHGPHALRLAPDGKSIYVACGNHTLPPFNPGEEKTNPDFSSRIPTNWNEDHLLPRQWDANGHARGILAPGGWVAKTDPDGKTWEVFSIGYRNEYDMAFNADGELFVYDADMEWDIGSPWYRPTRVSHATSGSEFGWRSGTGKWPNYYVDSLPEAIDIGPGSPVGVEFGYGAKFPAKYQRALYICDWTFGTMYALHFEPRGSTYVAVKEEFVARSPLPLTDNVVGADGALYFTIGGRGTQSELFRVTYVGQESTAPAAAHDAAGADLRALRRKAEAYHRRAEDPAQAAAFLAPLLGHPDRFLRYAARVGLEHQPTSAWQSLVLKSKDPETVITGVVGLAHQADSSTQTQLLSALNGIKPGALSETQRLEWLRAYQLVFTRMGAPDDEWRALVLGVLEPLYPAAKDFENRELCNLLVYLQSPTVVAKTLALIAGPDRQEPWELGGVLARNAGYGGAIAAMLQNQPDKQKIHYAFALRNVKAGWTLEQRKAYFGFLDRARSWSGGASFQGFLKNIDREAFENATDAERLAIEALGARKPYVRPELPKPQGPGKDWGLADVIASAENGLKKGRDFKNGEKMFAAARCVICHRFGGDGGATGPDLTQLAGRFNLKDLTEAIVDPSKVVSDQYRATTIATKSGKVHTGKIVSETPKALVMVIDPEDATKVVEIAKSDVEEQQQSLVSLMPKDLLKTLNENEVLDLLAYLLSRGNPQDAMFRK